MYFWSTKNVTLPLLSAEAKVSQSVGIEWFNYFKDICAEYFIAHPSTICSTGKKIGKSKFGKCGVEFVWWRTF